MIQNAAARLMTGRLTSPKEHVTPLFISLHWLEVAARIKFKTLMLAYRTTTGSAPSYFYSLLRIYIPSRGLRSASERRLVGPSQRGSKSLSRTFSFNWKLISFDTTWLHPKPKKKKLFLSLLLLLACTYLNNAWDLVLQALPLSVCLFKMNRFMYSPIVSHFG